MHQFLGSIERSTGAYRKVREDVERLRTTKLVMIQALLVKARSSVGERYIDTVEVGSSILPAPTIFIT